MMKERHRSDMEAVDALIARVYGSVLEPESFLPTLSDINRHLDCDGVHVVGWDRRANQMIVSMLVGDHLRSVEERYRSSPHYQRIDPRTALTLAKTPGVAVACHDFFDDAYVAKSEFYQDLLIPGGARYVLGGNIFHDDHRDIVIAFNHLVGRPQFSTRQRRIAERILPHLHQWTMMMQQASSLRMALGTGFHALEQLTQGVVALDGKLRVLYANPVAQRVLGAGLMRPGLGLTSTHPFGRDGGDLLREANASRQSKTFFAQRKQAVASLVVTAFAVPPESSVDGHNLPAGLQGLGGSEIATTGESLFHAVRRPSLVVLIRSTEQASPIGEAQLREIFGLTPSEARLAVALCDGHEPKSFAEQHQVSINTVRTQVRALLHKTGARSLRELVRLLAGLS